MKSRHCDECFKRDYCLIWFPENCEFGGGCEDGNAIGLKNIEKALSILKKQKPPLEPDGWFISEAEYKRLKALSMEKSVVLSDASISVYVGILLIINNDLAGLPYFKDVSKYADYHKNKEK